VSPSIDSSNQANNCSGEAPAAEVKDQSGSVWSRSSNQDGFVTPPAKVRLSHPASTTEGCFSRPPSVIAVGANGVAGWR
jgi:hypothetical protein